MTTQFMKKAKALDLVGQNIEQVSEGVCRYTEGWSDQRVAEASGLTYNVIRGIRQEAFGKIGRPPATTPEERIAELEETVATLDARIAALEALFTAPAGASSAATGATA